MKRRTGVTVVKIGGSLLEETLLRGPALDGIAARWRERRDLVLVHGGGKRVDAALAARGIPKRVQGGLRVTDAATLEVVLGVLAGVVNKSLVAELLARGVPAAGLSGADGAMLAAGPHPPVDGVDLGFVGRIASASPAPARALLRSGHLPVVASIAAGPGGALLNVNADAAAASLAGALGARRLVFLTDVEGLLDADGRLVPSLRGEQAERLLASPAVNGGMRPKLTACLEALAAGIPEIVIAGPAGHAAALSGGHGGTRLVAA